MSTEKTSNRKEWVKNAAIIFLSVMLVLTFFSNTIMNYSLPEVATAMIEPGSITAKIRGTGNLVSDDPYKITIQESRTIASVAVKQGDVVEKDQVLFYLEDEDSEELEAAQKALDELILAYSTAILNGDISQEAYQNIQGGKVTSTAEYQNRISAAKKKVEDAQTAADTLTKQIELAGTVTGDAIDKETRLKQAQAELADAEIRRTEAKANLQTVQTVQENAGNLSELQTEYNKALLDEGMKRTTYETAANYLYNVLKTKNPAFVSDSRNASDYGDANKFKEAFESIIGNSDKMNQLTNAVLKADNMGNGEGNGGSVSSNDIYMGETGQALTSLQTAYGEYKTAVSTTTTTKAELDSKQNNSNVEKYQKEYNSAENSYQYWKAVCHDLQDEIDSDTADSRQIDSSLKLQLTEANAVLNNAKDELAQLLTDISSELNLGNQNSIIREQREKIAKLRENAVGAVITAPVAGTVTNVNKIAGENITPNEELAIMQPEGKGFSMSFAVTPEQAKKVTVGEQAEIQNSWYYDDIAATLVGIRPDPESNGAKKLLVFDVKGDVQTGQSVSVSIGQRSANYDLLVPNSAVREDNNGKFILIVEAKNSPLGNRYMATRVDVEVLGSDDNKTAIAAPLYGYEYVITTATQPVEAGKQVRLAEN